MLKGEEDSTVLGTDHHRVHRIIRWRACPLTTDVKKGGAVVLRVVVVVIVPVPLLVSALILRIVVIKGLAKGVRGEVIHCDFEHLVGLNTGLRNSCD